MRGRTRTTAALQAVQRPEVHSLNGAQVTCPTAGAGHTAVGLAPESTVSTDSPNLSRQLTVRPDPLIAGRSRARSSAAAPAWTPDRCCGT